MTAALVVIGAGLVAPGPGTLDRAIGSFLKSLPGLLGWFWEISYDLLFLWAGALVVVTLVSRGRARLLLDEVLAATLAAVVAAGLGVLSGAEWGDSVRSLTSSDPPAVFPAVRMALATAVIAAASPHLSRPLRYLGRWVIGAGALASVVVGIAHPVGVVGGFAIGIGAAAVTHLLLGSPGGRLSLEQMRRVLGDLGVEVDDLSYAPLESRGVSLADATTPSGRSLLVKVYGRDAWDGQLLASLWASLWTRGEAPRVGGRLQQVEHEAFVTLFAERAGIAVLPVVTAGLAAGRDAVLVVDTTGARPLSSLDEAELTDALLDAIWRETEDLSRAVVSHGSLSAEQIFVGAAGTPAIGDLSAGTVGASPAELSSDRAQVLVATSLAAGRERAISAAVKALGPETAAEILPYLQPAVLEHATRRVLRDEDWSIDDLRDQLSTAIGVEPPELERLRRVTVRSVVTVVVVGLVAYALISAVSNVGIDTLVEEFRKTDLPWLVAALLAVPFVGVAQSFSTIGACIRPVRFGPVLMLQYAIWFIQLAVPSSAARIALEIRFFQRVGLSRTSAIAVGAIDSVSGFTVQLALIVVISLSGLASLGFRSKVSESSFDWTWLLVAAGVLVVLVGVVLAIPKTRTMIRTFVSERLVEVKDSLRVFQHPSKVAMIFGGNLTTQVLYAMILGACLLAFGHDLTLAELILANTVVSMFAGFMPVPGGMGVAEAGYTAALVALGVPNAAAMSTAIAFRLVTFYLPPIWGGLAMRWLGRHDYV
ncbi:MAG: lysylphosphatidylglycerol synthase transmembrane domain-containing protein [Actinomycetota bacterium]